MKTLIIFLAVFLNTSLLIAQTTTANSNNSIERNNDFFKMSQLRFLANLQNDLKILSQNSMRIEQLNYLDSNLYAKGEITDSIFELYKSRIAVVKNENDSLISVANNYQNELKSFSKAKKDFTRLLKELPVFDNLITKRQYEKETSFDIIEQELNASNLGAEKKQLKAILGNATEQQKKEVKKITTIDDVKVSMLGTGKIDSVTAGGVENRISNYLKKIENNAAEIKLLETSISTPQDYATNSASIKIRVFTIDSVVNKSAATREYSFKMMEEGLQKSTKTLFSLGAFFGPGGYAIPPQKLSNARLYFSPVVDSLIIFSNKYAEVFRTATIQVNGYADASQITKNSKLYNELSTYLKITEPSNQQLNIALSALRAEELSSLFTKIIKDKSAQFITLPKITFENFEVGRGEQLPIDTIKNYTKNDERRRIVIVYWSVLPN